MKPCDQWDVYFVTDPILIGSKPLTDVVHAACKAGVSVVQLRDKHASESDLVAQLRLLKPICAQFQVPLVVNDSMHLAKAADIDGVHLGQDDGDPAEARAFLGPDAIIGRSIDLAEESHPACNYLGLGPVHATSTKQDAGPVLGLDGLAATCAKLQQPVVAIGGITIDTTPAIIAAGAQCVAVVGAICAAADPFKASKDLLAAVATGRSMRA